MNTFIDNISSYVENDDGSTRDESNYTFTPTAATQSASDLNTLNTNATNISLTNVTTISASSLRSLGTLFTDIGDAQFTNATGFTTIAVSDTTVDAGTLASRISSYDTINGGDTTLMTLASGATIEVDASEITQLLDDERQ